MKRLSVFITGGSGFLGINLTRYLLNLDFDVTTYDLAEFDYDEKDRVRHVVGDIRDKSTLTAEMKRADFVVHAAAALPLYSPEDIYTTDVVGTQNVLEAAQLNGVSRVVHISSTAVYGIPDHHPLLEDDRLDGVGPYGQAKILAESECLEFRSKGMIVPILRPKSFVGPERLGVFALFYDWAKDRRGFPMIGNGLNRYQLLDVEDLCLAIWLCLTESAEAVNDTFNIGADEFTTMKEDYQAVLDRAGFGKRIRATPVWLVVPALKLLEKLNLSPLYKWVYETASEDSYVSIERAKTVLGFRPKYSNKQALIRNYEWYLAHYEKFANDSGVSYRVPWKQGAIGLVKHFF